MSSVQSFPVLAPPPISPLASGGPPLLPVRLRRVVVTCALSVLEVLSVL